jgi:acyl carrier protein
VLAAIEDEFDFCFDDYALSNSTTIQRILDAMDKKLALRDQDVA